MDLLEAGALTKPRYELEPRRVPHHVWRWLESARALTAKSPAEALYDARLEELELDLLMLESLGDAKRVRPLASRRFGTGRERVEDAGGARTLADVAARILSQVDGEPEPQILAAEAPLGQPSLAELMRKVAGHAGIEVRVYVESRLTAAAATGERSVFVADRRFGCREALRLAVHEVLGHLVAAANGRAQPLRIMELGTAGSFSDQEGLALCLEEQAGLLDGHRLRTIAARVWVTDRVHAGATFVDTARILFREYGFRAEEAVILCERGYRGGGCARDAGYLSGYLRVSRALASGRTTIDQLRSGRVGVADVDALLDLRSCGLYRDPLYRPSLAYSLSATSSGTSPLTSPPNLAASFTMLELT
ncbi:MAG: tyrosine/phenylalanine carboxypeptidase domain-containing protein [Myxococcota bacterium]